jgi:hypothetical protein
MKRDFIRILEILFTPTPLSWLPGRFAGLTSSVRAKARKFVSSPRRGCQEWQSDFGGVLTRLVEGRARGKSPKRIQTKRLLESFVLVPFGASLRAAPSAERILYFPLTVTSLKEISNLLTSLQPVFVLSGLIGPAEELGNREEGIRKLRSFSFLLNFFNIQTLLSGTYNRDPSVRVRRRLRTEGCVEKVLNFVPAGTSVLAEFFSFSRSRVQYAPVLEGDHKFEFGRRFG